MRVSKKSKLEDAIKRMLGYNPNKESKPPEPPVESSVESEPPELPFELPFEPPFEPLVEPEVNSAQNTIPLTDLANKNPEDFSYKKATTNIKDDAKVKAGYLGVPTNGFYNKPVPSIHVNFKKDPEFACSKIFEFDASTLKPDEVPPGQLNNVKEAVKNLKELCSRKICRVDKLVGIKPTCICKECGCDWLDENGHSIVSHNYNHNIAYGLVKNGKGFRSARDGKEIMGKAYKIMHGTSNRELQLEAAEAYISGKYTMHRLYIPDINHKNDGESSWIEYVLDFIKFNQEDFPADILEELKDRVVKRNLNSMM